ncbi:hypothetical protein MVEG_01147 [Podila verticillata NRRL 6337]|nr:hypothetical protein MVEG_01147 [Podila verticillata NRRL 6337]
MKIVIIKMNHQEHGLCSGKYSGTAKLLSTVDGGLVEENSFFETTSVACIPFSDGAYIVLIGFGILGRKLIRIEKDGQVVPLHQVVMTNSQNSAMIFDEHS